MRAGILMPINPFLEADAIASMLKAARATVLLVEGSSGVQGVAQKLPTIRAALPNLRVFVCGEGEVEDGLDAFADGSQQPLPPLAPVISPVISTQAGPQVIQKSLG